MANGGWRRQFPFLPSAICHLPSSLWSHDPERGAICPLSLDLDLALRCKSQLTVCHYDLPHSKAFVDDRVLSDGTENGDRAHLDGVAVHDVNVLPLLSDLHGACGNDDRVVALRHFHRDGDELSGPQRTVAIRERRFQRDRAGPRIDRVVDE